MTGDVFDLPTLERLAASFPDDMRKEGEYLLASGAVHLAVSEPNFVRARIDDLPPCETSVDFRMDRPRSMCTCPGSGWGRACPIRDDTAEKGGRQEIASRPLGTFRRL